MKSLTKILAIIVFTFLFLSEMSFAQSNEPPVLIVSSQKVKMGEVQTANKMINEKFALVLNGLVDDGMLNSWGLFNHSWGESWNVNVWYVVKDMNAFDSFWKEYVKRVREKHPDAFGEFTALVMEHKDNIYTIQNQYPLPPVE